MLNLVSATHRWNSHDLISLAKNWNAGTPIRRYASLLHAVAKRAAGPAGKLNFFA
jgi:hypothetical protein